MPAPQTDPNAKLVEQINANMESIKKTQGELQTELKNLSETGAKTAEAVKKVDELAATNSKFSAQILELEQKMAENVKAGKSTGQTLGQMVIKSEAFKQYAAGNSSKLRIEANTIIGQEGSPPANSDTIVAPQRLSGIIPGAFRLLTVRDVLPQGTTNSNLVEYTRELAFTNNAAETAEGASKPESSLTFELQSTPIRTIAHWLKVSKQVLSDAPALQSYIDTRLRYGVEYRIDSQLINGDGTGQNISGILDTGNFTAFTPVTGENALDSINRAIYLVYAADYAPTAIIMNPAAWGAIERTKVGASDNNYIVGDPMNAVGPRLWGLPVVLSNAVPATKFIVGSMPIAFQYWNRENTVVEMFEQDGDNATKNLVTVRAESRGALASYRPASVQAGNLTQ